MATVSDLVADSLLEIGVIAAGETLGAEDGASGLRTLNRLVNAWQAERVYIYTITRTTWAITSGDGTYTVGSGADVNVARPVRINAINVLDTSVTPNYERTLRLMTDQDWAALRLKTQTSDQPNAAYYNPTVPTGTLDLWPVPTSTTLTGVIYSAQAAAQFSALSDSVVLPPGYERMIVKGLAVELASQYGATVPPQLERQAQDALAVVLRSNRRTQEQLFDPGAAMGHGGSYDIYSDVP